MKKSVLTITLTLALNAALVSSVGIYAKSNAAIEPKTTAISTQLQQEQGYYLQLEGKTSKIKACVMVPMKATAKAMGYKVTKNKDKSYTIETGEQHTTINIGKNEYSFTTSIKGAQGATGPLKLNAAPTVMNKKVYVPIEVFQILSGDDEIQLDNQKDSSQIPSPLTEYDSFEKLQDAMNFTVQLPLIPKEYTAYVYQDISKKIAEVRFVNKQENQIIYRVSKGSEDISGDSNVYKTTKQQKVKDITVTCKGNGNTVNLAVWNKDGYAYSINSEEGISIEQIQNMVESLS